MSNVPIIFFCDGSIEVAPCKEFFKKFEVWSCFLVLKRKSVNVHQ